jgi:membrane protein EpsK
MNSAWSRAAFGPRQTFLNIGANVAQLALGTAASLLLVPFLVRHLGVARFGLVPLTTSLSTYLSLLGVGLNSATSRELSHALGKGDATRAGGVFSAAVATSLVLAAIMVLLTILLVPVLPRIISIPAGEEAAARWLLACVFLAFAIGTVAAPFGAASFTLNRFDLRVLVQLGQQLAYVLLVLVFFSVLGWTRLEAVGVAVLSGSLLALATSVWTHRRLLPDLRPSVRFESRQMLQIGSLGGWLVLNQLGTVLFLGIDLWVVNRLLGPTVAGRYGAVLQGSQLIRALEAPLGAHSPRR